MWIITLYIVVYNFPNVKETHLRGRCRDRRDSSLKGRSLR